MGLRSSNLHYNRAAPGRVWIGLLLAVLLCRAWIPVGFMPAAGSPFQLQVCPVGLDVPSSMHHGMSHDAAHAMHGAHPGGTHAAQDCPFGSAPALGPTVHHLDVQPPGMALSGPELAFELPLLGSRAARAHQPRGPPSLA